MIGNLMSTIAMQKYLANIASIAQSLRVIAEVMKEQNENKNKKEQQ